jgi:hypothetical protein
MREIARRKAEVRFGGKGRCIGRNRSLVWPQDAGSKAPCAA